MTPKLAQFSLGTDSGFPTIQPKSLPTSKKGTRKLIWELAVQTGFESRFAGYTFRNSPFIVQWFRLVNTSTIPALREGLMRAGLPILFVAFGQLCAVAVAQGQQEQPAALKQMLRNAEGSARAAPVR